MPTAGCAAIRPIPQDPPVLTAAAGPPGGWACCLIISPKPEATEVLQNPYLTAFLSSLIITKLA